MGSVTEISFIYRNRLPQNERDVGWLPSEFVELLPNIEYSAPKLILFTVLNNIRAILEVQCCNKKDHSKIQ